MKAVIQRVLRGEVRSRVGEADAVAAAIGPGLAVLIGFEAGDSEGVERWAADRVAGLRVFEDEAGKMNLDVHSVRGGVIAVPNFTLAADPSKGRPPGFSGAMHPAQASERFDAFCAELARLLGEGEPPLPGATGDAEVIDGAVARGVFGSAMHLEIINDGPVTLVLER